MFDIMFDIEFNRIKKRYGNIVSFNIGQTCGFSFMNSDFVKDKTVVAVFIRGDLEFAVEMKLIGNEYKCNFPDELCDSAETYKLTVIAFTNDAEAPTDFRSTTAYYGTIEDSGCDGTKFTPKHTETVFESVGHILVSELRTSLETATGESQEGKTWDEMVEAVRDMSIEPFIEPMLGFFEEYYMDFNETPVNPPGGDIVIDPDIPAEQNEGGDENVTE